MKHYIRLFLKVLHRIQINHPFFSSETLNSNVSRIPLSIVPCDYTTNYTFSQKQFVLYINNSVDTNKNWVEREFKSNAIVRELQDVP